jgi:hypothetical protein
MGSGQAACGRRWASLDPSPHTWLEAVTRGAWIHFASVPRVHLPSGEAPRHELSPLARAWGPQPHVAQSGRGGLAICPPLAQGIEDRAGVGNGRGRCDHWSLLRKVRPFEIVKVNWRALPSSTTFFPCEHSSPVARTK